MENILSTVEGNSSTEISTVEQINENLLKEFLNKTSIWDFYETSKEEYMNKNDDEKISLIISYYNFMISSINLLFGVSFSFEVTIFILMITRSSPVRLLFDKFCSVLIVAGRNEFTILKSVIMRHEVYLDNIWIAASTVVVWIWFIICTIIRIFCFPRKVKFKIFLIDLF